MASDDLNANSYDSFAEAYVAETEHSLVNAFYERPAVLSLAGDVSGRRILDAGCGAGPLFAELRSRGADVTGLDSSIAMLRLARHRLGDQAELHHADLAQQLPFDDAVFDDVIASLVLHYLEDWSAPLDELRRVLMPGGRLIASVEHPFQSHAHAGAGANYFATRLWSFEWVLGGEARLMSFWHRPLHAMVDAFTAAGFQIAGISEPQPHENARSLFPDDFDRVSTEPNFLFFVLTA